MKTLATTLILLFGNFAYGDDPEQKPLQLKIKNAATSNSVVNFESGDGLRKVTFRNGELKGNGEIEPIFLSISKVILRVDHEQTKEISLDDAKALYKEHSLIADKAGVKPMLVLALSMEHSDDKLLSEVIITLCPPGNSTVWIRTLDKIHDRKN